MRYLKITIGLLGIILFVLTAMINLRYYVNLKKNGVRNIRMDVKTNPDIARKAKMWGFIGNIGFWLMVLANYIN